MARIVFTTGAGISVPSGIPPYRGTGGIYTENPQLEQLLHAKNLNTQYQKIVDGIDAMKAIIESCAPNKAHYAIAELEHYHDITVITQNVDDFHNQAGSTNVIELHGNIHKTRLHTDGDPRPDVVLFGEDLNNDLFMAAMNAVENADVIVAVGTSGDVAPANQILDIANDKAFHHECAFYYIAIDKPEMYLPFAYQILLSAEYSVPTLCETLKTAYPDPKR